MPVLSKHDQAKIILPVPYFIQPTTSTCQATCLKMMATYIDNEVVNISTNSATLPIEAIKESINSDPNRTDQQRVRNSRTGRMEPVKNSHENMKWWLKKRFPTLKFKNFPSPLPTEVAVKEIVKFISSGSPIMTSVSHEGSDGHFIMVIGYVNYQANTSLDKFQVVVHDPYGKFDPGLWSNLYGVNNSRTGGSSIGRENGSGKDLFLPISGGETGPGKDLYLPITSASRRRSGDTQMYRLIGIDFSPPTPISRTNNNQRNNNSRSNSGRNNNSRVSTRR